MRFTCQIPYKPSFSRGGTSTLVYSNNYAEVDASAYIECGECLSACLMEVIALPEKGPAAVLEAR